jgi:hypothetical protein
MGFCGRTAHGSDGPEEDSVRYASALSVLFICVRFGSFQFGRTKWHV